MLNDPLDVDRFWPIVAGRDEALDVLQSLLSDRDAELVWNRVVQPLYDLMKARHLYPDGRCRCGALHPAKTFGENDRAGQHRMWCERYVGPIHHTLVRSGEGVLGNTSVCSCGQRYSSWVDNGEEYPVPGKCPDRLVEWRGPRPSSPEESRMTDKKKDEQQAEAQEGQETAQQEQERGEDGLTDAEREQQEIQRLDAEDKGGITDPGADEGKKDQNSSEGQSFNV